MVSLRLRQMSGVAHRKANSLSGFTNGKPLRSRNCVTPKIFFLGLVLVLCLTVALPLLAQANATAVVQNHVNVRTGPGTSFLDIGGLDPGVTVTLDGRNADSSWVLLHTADNSVSGWVAAAYIAPGDGFDLASLPVDEAVMAENAAVDHLRTAPVVPGMTGTARAIYQRGLALGNNPNRFSKVGDCQNVSDFFLGAFDHGNYTLGDHSHLQTTIDHFGGSWARRSMSVASGFNIYAIHDPMWSSAPCQSAETPLECEYRLWQPSFVIISLETIDGITVEGYESALRQTLDFWIEHGVVPIIATKADNIEGDWSYNVAIMRVAREYDVPLWNFMMAAQPLPNFGLTDGFHLTYANNNFGDAAAMQNAWPWRNLTALQTLDAMRRGSGQ